jgi:hypothetical protein
VSVFSNDSNDDDDDDDDESFITPPIFATTTLFCRLARRRLPPPLPSSCWTKDASLRRATRRPAIIIAFNEAMAASETMDFGNPRFELCVFFFFFFFFFDDDGDGGVLRREREQRGRGHDKLAFVEI